MDEKDMIIAGLIQAIQAEFEGHIFYKMSAEKTDDEQGAEAFRQLAKDEMEHYTFLKAQYDSFLRQNRPDMDKKLGKSSQPIDSPIFSANFKSRLKDAHYEMTALSIGVQLELSAINFYKSEAAKISEPTAKKFFKDLAEWESAHYRRLLKQQQELKEEYWQDANFSPS